MKKILLIVFSLLVIGSCGSNTNEFKESLDAMKEFNEKYADTEKFERDKEDKKKDRDLLSDFKSACQDNTKEYPLYETDGQQIDFIFPQDLPKDTNILSNNCVKAGQIYVEYLKGDYSRINIRNKKQKACLQEKIKQTESILSGFKSTNLQLSSRYGALPMKIIAYKDQDLYESELKMIGELYADYGKFKIAMVSTSTLHLITKDICIASGIQKAVLETFNPASQEIQQGFEEATNTNK